MVSKLGKGLRVIKGHYATTLPICACADYETKLLHLNDTARWSHSAVQRRKYFRANCQYTARGGCEKCWICPRKGFWTPQPPPHPPILKYYTILSGTH